MPTDNSYGRSYRRAAALQIALKGEKGYEIAVGGEFEAMGAAERALVDCAGLPPDGFLIDIGCGSGRLAVALKDRPKLLYLGLDVAPLLLARARELTARDDWRFEQVGAPVVPAGDAVADMVTMFSLITHLPPAETRAYLCEAARVLKPGGGALVSFLDPALPQHRKQIRPPWLEALVTRMGRAPNVANTPAEIGAWAREAGLSVERIDSPSAIGQSLALLRKT